MPDAIFILHAQDVDMEAAILSAYLNQAGIYAVTYRQAVGGSTHSEVQENWDTLVEYVPAFIILASPGLFEDYFLIEMFRETIAERKGFPVIYGDCENLPSWFIDFCIPISRDSKTSNRGWNRLIDALNKYVGVWDTPTAFKVRPN